MLFLRMVDVILKKRHGDELTRAELSFFVKGYVAGDIPDYQASAFLMAICINGLSKRETADLTLEMTHSGDVVDLSAIEGIKVDKHSTGGVGDTTTLIVAPLVAACGVPVAKMSGRGLGHTGGTLDKLESIRGVNVLRPINEFIDIVKRIGIAVIGQTGDLVPADKLMYALRDVTGTVESIPLIASSIMSKKIAAGSDAIVLDVKIGSGAFMHTKEDALALAHEMVDIGAMVNRRTVAIITDMNKPLGMAVGNTLEVAEAIEALSGKIEENDPLIQVSLLLGRHMLLLGGKAKTEEEAQSLLLSALRSGRAKEKLREFIIALGGDSSCVDDPARLGAAAETIDVCADESGFISSMDAQNIGIAAMLLGAGRVKKTDTIDPVVGLVMKKRVGDRVEKGEPLAAFQVNNTLQLDLSIKTFKSAIHISGEKCAALPMVYAVISAQEVQEF